MAEIEPKNHGYNRWHNVMQQDPIDEIAAKRDNKEFDMGEIILYVVEKIKGILNKSKW